MAERFTLSEIRARTYKERDAWWTVLLVDPLASRLVQLVAPLRWVTPNLVTTGAFVLGAVAAWFFALGDYKWLVAGAIVFHFSFVLDCMDGKIARLKGNGSLFGAWFDYVFDRLRVVVCAVALMVGQYAKTDNIAFLWLAGVVIFLDMFRYLNALQMGKVKGDMRRRLEAARLEAGIAPEPAPADDAPVVSAAEADFRQRHGTFAKLREALVKRRIRAHVFSGIEFQMFVFIVAPLTSLVLPVTILASVLLLAFELLLIYKLYSATQNYYRELAKIPAPVAAGLAPAVADLDDEDAVVDVVDEDDTVVLSQIPAAH
ncbi:CDP-alcohol phosphatidyltransferase family protein [Symbioplanes lichenis]|uniref:CDP-alcohol phosphatidyltransferase family protein n=1 Tax=Symbioplanes lichenis TaxID=1629072 RepID=UPI0027390853|nr:CDP-alcohol phosphatidyltransferase family protein [Actinoplanes lichenis]